MWSFNVSHFLPVLPRFQQGMPILAGLVVTLLSAGDAHASVARLEADLQAQWGRGEQLIEIGELREQEHRVIAEHIVIRQAQGDVVTIEAYHVQGDYDQPESVSIHGIRVIEPDVSDPVLTLTELALDRPGAAVPDFTNFTTSDAPLHGLRLQELSLWLDGTLAKQWTEEWGNDAALTGYLTLQALVLEEMSDAALGRFELQGLKAEFNDLASGFSASLGLDELSIRGLEGLDRPGEEQLAWAEVNGFSLTGDRWSVLLERAWASGNLYVSDMGFQGAALDMGALIGLAPPQERLDLQAVNNVLTGGSGRLNAAGRSVSEWHEDTQPPQLKAEGFLQLSEAGEVSYQMALPVTLPGRATIEQAMQHPALFETARLHGGNVTLAYKDAGLLPRLATELATQEGISTSQMVAQGWAQARQFERLAGPQVAKLMVALVDIMGGYAQSLTTHIALPDPFTLEQFMMDPLGSSQRLRVTFELK
ncbi:hypothetical protein LG409_05765 [Halomonas sp. NyZ770]|uniref:hypothetical protein n=1 Tax=Halomonas sp. NyZ770 TaxID=2883106 RepID=UPI001D09DA09|nr:hypothetical protein [Halomonas sp. NyZ770]UDM08411.1 hypothetical protein LG409_05765 [Halomonas sp. NyZ770]